MDLDAIDMLGDDITMDDLVEEDGIAGRNVLHKEKGDKVKPYPCKEPGCVQKFGGRGNLKSHIGIVHSKERSCLYS